MKKINLLLLFVLFSNLCFAQSGVNFPYTEFPAGKINPIINQSNINPLRLTDKSKTINGLSFYEQVNGVFHMPSYYNTNTENRVDKFVYVDRNGVGPSLTLYYFPFAKTFKRYVFRKAGWFNQDDHFLRENWLQFGNEVNGLMTTGVGNYTLTPALGQTFEVKLKYKFISTMRSRNSNNWSESHFNSLDAPPNVGADQCDTREENPWETADAFKIVTKEAKWIEIDESLLSLKFCNEEQTINLYDYFSDKLGVTFSLDGTDLPNEYLNIGDIGKGDYTLTATKKYENGTFTESIALKIVNMPSRIVEVSNATFCQGTTSTLTASEAPEGETYTYRWSSGETTRSITVSSTYSGKVTISNGSCEVTSETVSATMLEAPKPTITNQTGNNNICDGESAVLVTNQVAQSYSWLNQDDVEVGTQQSFYATKAGTYRVIAFYQNGCQNVSDPMTITVTPNPAPTITATGDTEFCEGESVMLTASLPNGQIATQYQWSNGQIGQTITVTEGGIYTVTARNNNGCARISEAVVVKTKPNPKPLISTSGALEFCDGGSVKLTVTNAQGATGVLWSTGETTTSIEATTTGTYYVTVFREDCNNTSEEIQIQVHPNVTPTIQALGDAELCEGESVTLQVTNPQPNTDYTWSNGATGLEIEVSATGQYYVIAKNQFCSSNSISIPVVVNPIHIPVVMANGVTEFCEGGSVTLTVTNASDQDNILWSNGETTRSITVTSSGRYYATLSKNNCERTSEYIDVTVYPNPKPTIEALGDAEFCEGGSVTLQVTNPQPNSIYTWSDGTVGRQTTVSTSGNYFVSSQNENGCLRTSDQIAIRVFPIAKPTVHISGETTFCEGDSIILTINEAGNSYRWSNGEITKSITVKRGATYTAYIGNEFGCERASDPIGVTVNPNPKPTINYASLVACEGDSVKLTASNGESYLWSNGETTKDIWVKYSSRYSVVVTNAFGCSNVSDSVKVEILPNSLPTITSSNGFDLCEGETTVLTASEGAFYLWSNGETTRTITVSKAGNYSVTVTNSNSCSRTSNQYGVKVHQPLELTSIPDQQICISGDKLNLDGINTNELGGVYEGEGVIYKTFDPAQAGEGMFKIKYTYTTEQGCVSTIEFDIEVVPVEVLETGEDIEVCMTSGDILLQVEGLPVGVIFEGNGVTGNLFKPQDAGVGIHEILYTYTNKFGCISTARRIITVTSVPTAPEVSGNNPTCNNNAITLIAQSTILDNRSISYNWYREGDDEPFDTGQQIRYVVTKNEKIYVQAVSQKGCPSERTEVLISSYTPEVRLTASATTISQGSAVQFTLQDMPSSNPSIRWEYDFGDGFRSQERNPLHYYNKAGVYTVKVKAYAEQECFAEVIEEDFIVVEENPIVVDPPITGGEPIEDNNPFYSTIVYPNPIKVGEQAIVRVYNENNGASRAILQVYTISGSPILEQHLDLDNGQNEIPVQNLDRLTANTYYLFVVKFEDGRTESIKVLIL